MRALCAVALLLAAGCGGDPPAWSTSFDLAPGARLSVTAWRGTVRLRNSTSGKFEVTVRGDAPLLPVVMVSAGPKPWLRVAEAAKDANLAIEIAAPPGTSLSCTCADARVEVGGAWGALEIKTQGAITARVERADSGVLESQSGAVLYAAVAGPTGELAAKSVRGDVTVRLPATWNGLIDCTTRGGKLDVPPHKSLLTIWDEDKKHVVGRVGPPRKKDDPPRQLAPMGSSERDAELIATVWGSSVHGSVSLHLGE